MYLPKVSIQIPTYNQASFLDATITSCLTQKYENIEINIADDNSSDNTKEVVEKYLHDIRIHYYKSKENLGRVKNYRKALYEYATGDWVLNLDGDDILANDHFISHAMELILQSENVLFLQGSHRVINPDFSEKIIIHQHFKNKEVSSAKNYFLQFNRNKHFSHLATIFHKDTIKSSDFYSKNIISSDIYSTLKSCLLFPDNNVILTNEVGGNWILKNDNASQSMTFKQNFNNSLLYFDLFKLYLQRFGLQQIIPWFIHSYFVSNMVFLRQYLIRSFK